VPKASAEVIEAAIDNAVSTGGVWLSSGPASLLGEPIPVGVLNPMAKLQAPPEKISAAAILPENLPGAWSDGQTTALAIATALSLQAGVTLPWKTVRDAIGGAIQARFLSLAADSSPWPSDLAAAQTVKLQLATAVTGTGVVGAADSASRGWTEVVAESKRLVAEAELEPSGIQDLADLIPELLEIKNRFGTPVSFRVRIEFGDGKESPRLEATGKMNELLENLKDGFSLR
jgi:hypothetical protein